MSTIVKVKASSFIGRNGKLISRKAYRRILGNKIPLSKAKNRVKALRTAINRVKLLTSLDKDKLEYGVAINKLKKEGNIKVTKGVILEQQGRKIPVVDIPRVNNEKRYWYVHSHPDNVPLSLGDITFPNSKGGTVFAVDPEGSVYRATRLSSKPEDMSMMIYHYNTARKKIRDSGIHMQAYQDAIRSDILMEDNAIKTEIQQVIQHRVLKHLNDKGYIRYRSKLSKEAKDRLKRYADIMSFELRRYGNLIKFKR